MFIFGNPPHIQHLQVESAHQGHRVKVKVTEAKRRVHGSRSGSKFWMPWPATCSYICGISRSTSYMKVIRSRLRSQEQKVWLCIMFVVVCLQL